MRKSTKKCLTLSLIATTLLSCSFAFASLNISTPVKAEETVVAKVGDTEYVTIDAAVANWTAGTTLTLLDDVTLSDVITLNSTEHHILNLGEYTITAAEGKNAIEITPKGVGTAAKSCLTIDADSENPGAITATGKACIYYNNANKINDRLTVTINAGEFNGSYAVNSTSGPLNKWGNCTSPLRGQGAPYYVINGGTFNAQVYLNAAMLKVTGGTFHKNLTCMGDTTAYRSITGGRFSGMTMTADAEHKFYLGWRESVNGQYIAHYDVGAYVDEDNYLVVGGPVITNSDGFEAIAPYSLWNSCLKYSSVANGLYYKSAVTALKKNNTSAKVTLLEDELDLTEVTSSMSSSKILLGEDEQVVISFKKANETKLPKVEATTAGQKIVFFDKEVSTFSANGDTAVVRTYTSVEEVVIAQVDDTLYYSVDEMVSAIKEDSMVVLYEDIALASDETQPKILALPRGVTLIGNNKTLDATVYVDGELNLTSNITITNLYVDASATVNTNESVTLNTENMYVLDTYTFTLKTNKTALKANEHMTVTVAIDKDYYSAEYTFTYDTSKFTCAMDNDGDGVIFVSNLYKGQAGDLATYAFVAKNDIQSVYEGDEFAVSGNVVQYKEQLLNGVENPVVDGKASVKISLNYTANVKADYVQGYSLVLVKGDDAGYAYNNVKMFYVEAYEAYAVIVAGKVTAEDIDAALSKATDCEVLKPSYNVNAEYVADGKVDLKDATMVYACTTVVDFAVADYMELYLRADVNGDGRVSVVDINAVTKNYTK